MGMVYEAHDRGSGATVALKLIRSVDPRAIARLKHEFRTLADVAHPNLITLLELSTDGGQVYFTMERIDGVDLGRWMRHPRSATELKDVLRQLAAGVEA